AERAVRPDGLTPGDARLEPGRYLVVAVIDGRGLHEFYRTVPAQDEDSAASRYSHQSWTVRPDGSVDLPDVAPIPITAEAVDGLARFTGGQFDVGLLNDALVPRHSQTIAPFYMGRQEVTVGEFRKVVGVLPPAFQRYAKLRNDSHPMTFVSYSAALEY